MSELTPMELHPGLQVGGYTLVSRLGGGAMGTVWRVHDDGGQEYAMKLLRESQGDEANDAADADTREFDVARERLHREAAALQRIRHPGVCRVLDMELDETLAFIVTELIDGRNLRDDVAANGRYVGDDLERLAGKLIDATDAVHAAGIVHRDIKPTNVMISQTGPVLVDFGIAMGEGESHVTRTGMVMGTPGFIAPEIIDGAESDARSDWWSVAAVLAFAATGRPVFGSKPMMAVLERAAAGQPNLTGLPTRTMQAFRAALAPRREERCTPRELLEAIATDADSASWRNGPAMPPFPPGPGAEVTPDTQQAREQGGDAETVPMADETADTRTLTRTIDAIDLNAADRDEASDDASDPDNPRTMWLPEGQPQRYLPHSVETQAIGTQTEALPDEPDMTSLAAAHARLLHRSWPVIAALGSLCAGIAALLPAWAAIISAALLWLLTTLGAAAELRLSRMSKRAGAARISDYAVGIAALPWHALKGLAAALPRILIMLATYVALTALIVAVASLPTSSWTMDIAGLTMHLPLPDGTPRSSAAGTLALAQAAGWCLAVTGRHCRMTRLGAGACRGVADALAPAQDEADTTHRVRMALLLIWLAAAIGVGVMLAGRTSIDWSPLLLARH